MNNRTTLINIIAKDINISAMGFLKGGLYFSGENC